MTTISRCQTASRCLSRSLVAKSKGKDLIRTPLLSTSLSTSSSPSSSFTEIPFYGLPRPPRSSSSSPLQRLVVAVHSAITAFADPTRADAVAALGEVTGHVALTQMYDIMMSDATGQRILNDKPIVGTSTLPIGDFIEKAKDKDNSPMTFGKAYGIFLLEHGFDPDERHQVKYIADPELMYVMTRYRQCHDFWHVLTGLPPTVLGELGLKWLELLQTGLPVAALSATVGSLRLSTSDRQVLTHHYLPWAIRVSQQSVFLLNVYYEKEFDTDLVQLRERLGVEPAPIVA